MASSIGRGAGSAFLVLLMGAGSVFMWIGVPILWLYLASQLYKSSQPSFGVYFGVLVAIAVTGGLGVAGLLAAPGLAPFWSVLIGLGHGGSLGLGLILPVLRARSPELVASLTAMTLSVGYLTAAVGPWVLGAAHDLSSGWTVPLIVLLGITLAQLVPGLQATRARQLG